MLDDKPLMDANNSLQKSVEDQLGKDNPLQPFLLMMGKQTRLIEEQRQMLSLQKKRIEDLETHIWNLEGHLQDRKEH